MGATGSALLDFTRTALGPELLVDPTFQVPGAPAWRSIGTAPPTLDAGRGLLRFLYAGNLITNGDFPTDVNDWSTAGSLGTFTFNAGKGRLAGAAGQGLAFNEVKNFFAFARKWFVPARYRLTFDLTTISGTGQCRGGAAAGASTTFFNNTGLTTGSHEFFINYQPSDISLTLNGPHLTISFLTSGATPAAIDIDNVVLKIVDPVMQVWQALSRKAGDYRFRIRVRDLAGGTLTVKVVNDGGDVLDETISATGTHDFDFVTTDPGMVVQVIRDSDAVEAVIEEVSVRPYENASSQASVVVTGQTTIPADALVEAWVQAGDSTVDHDEDEHRVDRMRLRCGDVQAGVGFTIFAELIRGTALGQYQCRWAWQEDA